MQFGRDTPRSIRIRLTRGRTTKSKHDQALSGAMPSTGAVMMSPTGREAMGPWTGAFEEAPLTPSSPTVFTDFRGVVFADLQGSPVASFTEITSFQSGPEDGGGEEEEEEEQEEREVVESHQHPSQSQRWRGAGARGGAGGSWVDTHAYPAASGGSRRRMGGLMQPTRGQT